MYLPSMLFGGSSLIHLLASNPRVVLLFGLGTLMTSLLQSPFARPDVIGTAAYVEQLEYAARVEGAIDPAVVERAQRAARGMALTPTPRLTAIVEETLRACGSACNTVDTAAVLKNPAMLQDVLLLYTLNEAKHRRALAPMTVAAKTADVPR